ncbi:tRNA(fMet)-specific endonuclease VapC [Planctomycetes bacterium CA13]|uniref:tRNA(fMet)-specific endonuclease VapC n=1 Tax=Novipirellula herctigrandis TaxID=2527986 RepID=A0A5C5YZF6_9BACT|nr:tRNA(fMet)-specific endonuclease VapC [Planctomycetes bacterium CA13]
MSISTSDIVVLDSNVLIHWARQDRTGQFLLATYALDQRVDRPLVPTTVEGEVHGLAKHGGWGKAKMERLDDIFGELVRIEAGLPEVIDAYAELYDLDRRGGHNTGQNDMWIAAATKAVGGVLMTCDNDFNWMHSGLVRVEHVEPQK